MAFRASSAAQSASRLMSGKRSTRTPSKAKTTRLPVSRLPQGGSAKKDAVQRNDRGMTSRMKQPSNLGA